jgi:hypothetical protein
MPSRKSLVRIFFFAYLLSSYDFFSIVPMSSLGTLPILPGMSLNFMDLCLIAALLLSLPSLVRLEWSRLLSWRHLVAVGFLLVVSFSYYVTADDISAEVSNQMRDLINVGSYFVIVGMMEDEADFSKYYRWMSLVLVLSVCVQLLRFLGLMPEAVSTQYAIQGIVSVGYTRYTRYNFLYAYLLLPTFFFAVARFRGGRRWSFVWMLLVTVFLVGVVIGMSRKYYFMALAGLVLSWYLGSRRSWILSVGKFAPLVVVLGFALMLIASSIDLDPGVFAERASTIYSQSVTPGDTYLYRLDKMDWQLEILSQSTDIFLLGSIFSSRYPAYVQTGLIVNDLGVTEEVMVYGAAITLLLVVMLLRIGLEAWQLSRRCDGILRETAIACFVFTVCTMILFPTQFSLFHGNVNMMGTFIVCGLVDSVRRLDVMSRHVAQRDGSTA